MTTLNRFFLVFTLLAFVSCSKKLSRVGSDPDWQIREAGEEWKNPLLEHNLTSREDPIKSFPFDSELTDLERSDPLGFERFIQRVNSSFSESGLSQNEADLVYLILQKSELLQAPPSSSKVDTRSTSRKAISIDKVKERVAIKRISGASEIDIFYKVHECGWEYSHAKVSLNFSDSLIIQMEKIESWVARTPC